MGGCGCSANQEKVVTEELEDHVASRDTKNKLRKKGKNIALPGPDNGSSLGMPLKPPSGSNSTQGAMSSLREDSDENDSSNNTFFKKCREGDRPDPRFWEKQFQDWIVEKNPALRPGPHPWPDHPWNTHPEMYDFDAHMKYMEEKDGLNTPE